MKFKKFGIALVVFLSLVIAGSLFSGVKPVGAVGGSESWVDTYSDINTLGNNHNFTHVGLSWLVNASYGSLAGTDDNCWTVFNASYAYESPPDYFVSLYLCTISTNDHWILMFNNVSIGGDVFEIYVSSDPLITACFGFVNGVVWLNCSEVNESFAGYSAFAGSMVWVNAEDGDYTGGSVTTIHYWFDSSNPFASVLWFYPCETYSDTSPVSLPLGAGTVSYTLSSERVGGSHSFDLHSDNSGGSTSNGLEVTLPNTGLVLTNFTYVFGFYVYVNSATGAQHYTGGSSGWINNFNKMFLLVEDGGKTAFLGVGVFANASGFSFASAYDYSGAVYGSGLKATNVRNESVTVRSFDTWYHVEMLISPSSKKVYVDGTLDFVDAFGGGSVQPKYVCLSEVTYSGSLDVLVDSVYVASDLGVDVSSYNAVYQVSDFQFVFSPSELSRSQTSPNPYEYFVSLSQGVGYTYTGSVFVNGIINGSGTFQVYATGVSSDTGVFSGGVYSLVVSGAVNNGVFSFPIPAVGASGVLYQNLGLVVNLTSPLVTVFQPTYLVTWQIGGSGSSGGVGSGVGTVADFVVYFCILGMPALVMSWLGSKAGWGLQGLLFGAFLGLGVGIICNLVPFWFVFMLGLFLVMFLYSLVRRS